LIVAAAGNNGTDQVAYPAANQGVIAVGAVDKLGNHLEFSNTGSKVDISAPGYGVNAAWTNNQAMSVSGTSFSSPIVAGVFAAVKSFPGNQNLTMRQTVDVVNSYLNDGGAAGKDPALGAGMPDLARVIQGKTPGIHDAAVASQRQLAPSSQYPNGQIEVLVQNRGTEPLVNTSVEISSPSGIVRANVTSLDVGQVRVITVPVSSSSATSLQFESRVTLSGGIRDVKPANDRSRITYVPAGAK
jgi:subtilisin family serine protease